MKTCCEFDKSVSFAVYKVNADTMQFDIEHKSVLLGNLSGRVCFEFDFWGLDKEKKIYKDVLPLHLKETFLPIIWITITEGEGDGIEASEARLPFNSCAPWGKSSSGGEGQRRWVLESQIVG